MPDPTPPEPNDGERIYWPSSPMWGTSQEQKSPVSEPPITRRVTLPEKVSVRFIAEVSGQSLYTIAALMSQMRILVDTTRSVDFADAARLLRRYGIAAEKEP